MQVSNHFSNHFGPILLILGFPLPAPLYSQFQRNWCYQLPNIFGESVVQLVSSWLLPLPLKIELSWIWWFNCCSWTCFLPSKTQLLLFSLLFFPFFMGLCLKKQDKLDTFVKYAVLPWNTVLNWIGSFQKAHLKLMVYRVWCGKFTQRNLLFELKGENIN